MMTAYPEVQQNSPSPEPMASAMQARFEKAVRMIQSLPKSGPVQARDEDRLALYALFKQATEGPCQSARPAFWDVVARAKWDAWNRLGGLAADEAMASYVATCISVFERYSDRPYAGSLVLELEQGDAVSEGTSPSPALFRTVIEAEDTEVIHTLAPSATPYRAAATHPQSFPEAEAVSDLVGVVSRSPSPLAVGEAPGRPVALRAAPVLTTGAAAGRVGSFMTPLPTGKYPAGALDMGGLAPVAEAVASEEAGAPQAEPTDAENGSRLENLVKAAVGRLRELELRVASLRMERPWLGLASGGGRPATVPSGNPEAVDEEEAPEPAEEVSPEMERPKEVTTGRLPRTRALVGRARAQLLKMGWTAVQAAVVVALLVFVLGLRRPWWPQRLAALRRRLILLLVQQV